MDRLPVIDVSGLGSTELGDRVAVAARLGAACRETGFFYLVGHGIPDALVARVFEAADRIFALDHARSGRWRCGTSATTEAGSGWPRSGSIPRRRPTARRASTSGWSLIRPTRAAAIRSAAPTPGRHCPAGAR